MIFAGNNGEPQGFLPIHHTLDRIEALGVRDIGLDTEDGANVIGRMAHRIG